MVNRWRLAIFTLNNGVYWLYRCIVVMWYVPGAPAYTPAGTRAAGGGGGVRLWAEQAAPATIAAPRDRVAARSLAAPERTERDLSLAANRWIRTPDKRT